MSYARAPATPAPGTDNGYIHQQHPHTHTIIVVTEKRKGAQDVSFPVSLLRFLMHVSVALLLANAYWKPDRRHTAAPPFLCAVPAIATAGGGSTLALTSAAQHCSMPLLYLSPIFNFAATVFTIFNFTTLCSRSSNSLLLCSQEQAGHQDPVRDPALPGDADPTQHRPRQGATEHYCGGGGLPEGGCLLCVKHGLSCVHHCINVTH
jgi:hypothetical protein